MSIIVLVGCGLTDVLSAERDDLQSAIDQLAAPTSISDAREASEKLFSASDTELITMLRDSPHDSVALRAAWEMATRELRQKEKHVEKRLRRATEISRFIGFVEGRLRISAPKHWRNRIFTVSDSRNGSLSFPESDDDRDDFYQTKIGLVAPKSVALSTHGDTVAIAVEGATVRTSLMELGLSDKPGLLNGLSATPDDEGVIVAVYSDERMPYNVMRFSKDGKKLWETRVWACEMGSSGLVGVEHRVTLVVSSAKLFVLGVGRVGAYVEVFDRISGRPLVRFGTTY